MKNKIYSIFDEKAVIFNTPFFAMNDALAVRSFQDLAADPSTTIYKHPEDYKLYELGEFCDFKGTVIPVDKPRFIVNAQLNLQLGEEDAPPNSTGATPDTE